MEYTGTSNKAKSKKYLFMCSYQDNGIGNEKIGDLHIFIGINKSMNAKKGVYRNQ